MTFQDDGDASDVDDADLCTDYGKGVFHGNVLIRMSVVAIISTAPL